MMAERTLTKIGFIKDENNLQLNKVFKNDTMLKKIHIDVYPENPATMSAMPFMLLLRTIEKGVVVNNDGNRLILKKTVEGFETHFMNIILSKMTECYCKMGNGCTEFVINVHNIFYKITVF